MKRPIGPGLRRGDDLPATTVVLRGKSDGLTPRAAERRHPDENRDPGLSFSARHLAAAGHIHVPGRRSITSVLSRHSAARRAWSGAAAVLVGAFPRFDLNGRVADAELARQYRVDVAQDSAVIGAELD